MQSKLTPIALAMAIMALVISAYALTREGSEDGEGTGPAGSPPKLAELEDRIDQLTAEVRELRNRPREIRAVESSVSDIDRPGEVSSPAAPLASEEKLKAMVDEAVEEKALSVTEEMRVKAKKEPSFEEFAGALELSDEQRDPIEQEVIRGQREVFAILEIRTDSGENLMDELVELYATSIAKPGRDPGWGEWFGKVLTERIPGTSETYATRIEAVKASVRDTFKREMSGEQYTEFARWGVDPIEIEGIKGSPGEALSQRIVGRAREMGADIPEEDGN